MTTPQKLILALPKGRILDELAPILHSCGIVPEAAFYDEKSRLLQFATNISELDIIRVRSFDVATFTAFDAAHLGVAGSDVIDEFDYSELYAPVDLKIGYCRLSVAMPEDEVAKEKPRQWSHVRVATKYPNMTRKYFAARGVQSECIKLNGAMEIAPALGLARRIVDLVSSGSTLKANGLVEVEKILDVSSRLVVNRTALKTMPDVMNGWIEKFRAAVK
ncbi:MAG: ATP phosphoribosyltransferase [Micavibrio aeruginosavorus]|uniref:ATP phosphoribosyltransferase n=1 Tax=Micavibrio aeruginosavorus TaxID=349221 RepID=A0A2W4ZWV9_9BACT|nr:MAG: ATP phosphoribosyltransferase [Micavibrio aeruginosavorus]